MRNTTFPSHNSRRVYLLFALASVLIFSAGDASAAVLGTGDVLPQQVFEDIEFGLDPLGNPVIADLTGPVLPFFGGPLVILTDDGMGGQSTTPVDLIVGGTEQFSGITLEDGTQIGTTTGSVTINSPSNTLPLIAPNVYIGMAFNGLGRVTLSDFGATLVAEEELFVGEDGDGELEIFNGAVVGVGEFGGSGGGFQDFNYEGGTAIIGANRNDTAVAGQRFVSEGLVLMDGFGSKFDVDELIVADFGLGTIEATDESVLRTETGVLGRAVGSTGRVSVSGRFTRWDNELALEVGRLGNGILEINDQAVVVSETITVNPTSFIEMGGGTLISRQPIVTDGIIRGSGRIESDLLIGTAFPALGELRNFGENGNNSPTQAMVVTGLVENNGTIQSLGGIMEFQSVVTNNFEIVLRDTEVHFKGGLANSGGGTITIGGDTTLHGLIDNPGGSIFVLSDSESLLVGDLTFSGSGIMALTLGDAAGTLDITGSADLGSALLSLDYSAGAAPAPGDSYQILQAFDGITYADSVVSGGGVLWDVVNTGTSLIATYLAAAAPMGADFNGDGIVDALDLMIWDNNYGAMGIAGSLDSIGDADGDGDVDGADFLRIQGDLGGPPSIMAAASTNVPEPSTLALAMLTVLCCPRRRATR